MLQHGFFNTPLAPATHLDGLELAAPYEGIGLRRIDLQLLGDVREGKKTGHNPILPLFETFDPVIHSLMGIEVLDFGTRAVAVRMNATCGQWAVRENQGRSNHECEHHRRGSTA